MIVRISTNFQVPILAVVTDQLYPDTRREERSMSGAEVAKISTQYLQYLQGSVLYLHLCRLVEMTAMLTPAVLVTSQS